MTRSIQIQSVLYHNEKAALLRAVENLANAIRVNAQSENSLSEATLFWGDASSISIFGDGELDALREQYKDTLKIKYSFFDENTGTAKGHNRMAQQCESEYIMVMNPDVVVNPQIFSQLLAPFADSHRKVALTEARQTPIEHHKAYNLQTGETSWASTACCVFTKKAFDEVGGFDADTFFMYCDDLDFSWMLRLAGYSIIYVPQAVVFHDKTLSAAGKWLPTSAEQYYSAEASLLMAHKWSNPTRVKDLLAVFANQGETVLQKAAKAYMQRADENRLPTPRDAAHTVAEFTTAGYGNYRFSME